VKLSLSDDDDVKSQVKEPEAVDPPLFAYLFYEKHSVSDIANSQPF